jgi:hypothetical protein
VSTVPNSQNLVVNPNWIRRVAQVFSTDADAPFFVFWTLPGPNAPSDSDPLIPYVPRSDWVAAFEDAIEEGQLRTTFNGYRAPKP